MKLKYLLPLLLMITTAHNESATHKEAYIVGTGQKSLAWHELLDTIFGNESRLFLQKHGIREGMHVADVGCGNGIMTCWLAKQVGPTGHVYAIDNSEAQIALVKKRAADEQLENITYIVSNAHETNLPVAELDIVYCRLLLIHLNNLPETIAHFSSLLKDEGIVVTEDLLRGKAQFVPSSPAYETIYKALFRIHEQAGRDPLIPLEFPRLFFNAGLLVTEHTHNKIDIPVELLKQVPLTGLRTMGKAFYEKGGLSYEEQEKLTNQISSITTETHRGAHWTQAYTVGKKQKAEDLSTREKTS